MTWRQLLRLGIELAIDAARGKLGPLSEPEHLPLPFRDAERQAKASRCAGREQEPRCK